MTERTSRPVLLRPEDLLYLEFDFINLKLIQDNTKSPYLSRIDPEADAFLVVYFPPQHIQEKAFLETEPRVLPLPTPLPGQTDLNENQMPNLPPVDARLAGKSRLVFKIPADILELPYTIDALLNWSAYTLSVAPNALPPDAKFASPEDRPGVAQPLPEHTVLEVPYRLFLSPNEGAGWTHTLQPVTRKGRTELWHTRLGVRKPDGSVDETSSDTRTVRAIWSPDYGKDNLPPTDGFLSSLSPYDRKQLVELSSNFQQKFTNAPDYYDPAAVQVDHLMLTSLGAWMKVRGAFNPVGLGDGELNLEEWAHTTTQGRDQYVRVVYAGYLYPFWHRASLVKITERKIQSPNDDGKNLTAYLRQRLYIIVREPIKRYENAGREMPFKEHVEIKTLVTPNLDKPVLIYGNEPGTGAFWVRVGEKDFQFQLTAQDTYQQQFDFKAGLIFVADIGLDTAKMTQVYNAYHASKGRRMAVVANERVGYATPDPTKPGETSLNTSGLYFTVEPKNSTSFIPRLQAAEVRIPAVEQLVGSQSTQTIQLYERYVSNAQNDAGIFAKLIDLQDPTPNANLSQPNPAVILDALQDLGIPADKAGGLSTPNIDISGISQHLGPVAGTLDKLADGEFSAADFFNRIDATLLGGVKLSEIVTDVFDGKQFPKIITQPPTATSIVTTLEWSPEVKDSLGGIFIANKRNNEAPITDADRAKLEITARIEKKLQTNAQPSFTVNGSLINFTINFLEVIAISFHSLTFVSRENEKLQVSANVVEDGIRFLGPLKFLNELQQFIPTDGFIDPPYLDVAPTGVTVGYNLALPPLAIGVFSLQNVSLGAALNLPFTGTAARLRFNFSERHNPFIITVTLFGGGGFFALALGLDGIEIIEAALEFGGNVSLDIGVASGGVYVMAGVYFKYEKENSVELSGYLRMGGHLSVLGLITVSLEFYLQFSYIEKDGNPKITGRATLTVKVEVLFFSTSVKLTVERTFSGSSNDPTFADVLTAGDWKTYGEAFA
jgi:hypothetical protein